MTDKIDKLENNDAHLVIDCRSLSGSRRSMPRWPPSTSSFRFNRPLRARRNRSSARYDREAPGGRRTRLSCGLGDPLRPCAALALLRATQDTPHRSRPRATAVTCLVDYRTSDHSMDEAVADPACELARLETSGRPAVLVEGPNRQAGKCLRSSSNCPPSRGLLTNVREVATHPDSDFSRPISRSKEWIARGVAIAHEKRRPWHWTSGNSSRTVNAGRPSR